MNRLLLIITRIELTVFKKKCINFHFKHFAFCKKLCNSDNNENISGNGMRERLTFARVLSILIGSWEQFK